MGITFTVHGKPVPQPRPRVTARGRFARAYVPADHPVHAYRQAIARAARAAGIKPAEKPLCVMIDAVFARAASHLGKSGVKKTAPQLPRADVDNIAKAVLDAMQEIIGDDSCVARLVVQKSFGSTAYTNVCVSAFSPSVNECKGVQ